MLFNSLSFLIFFPIVVLVYFIIPEKGKQLWLLLASYYFYMSWNAKYALLILASTIVTYLSGLLIEKVKRADYDADKKVLISYEDYTDSEHASEKITQHCCHH